MQGPGDTAMNNCLILKGDICHTPVLGEIETLKSLGLSGAIIGKAYYTGAIDLRRAIEVAK